MLRFSTLAPIALSALAAIALPAQAAFAQTARKPNILFIMGDDIGWMKSPDGTSALASPSSAYIYDWNLLPIGQLLWEKELMSYIDFPPLQLAASYNLEQVLEQVREMNKNHPSQ